MDSFRYTESNKSTLSVYCFSLFVGVCFALIPLVPRAFGITMFATSLDGFWIFWVSCALVVFFFLGGGGRVLHKFTTGRGPSLPLLDCRLLVLMCVLRGITCYFQMKLVCLHLSVLYARV